MDSSDTISVNDGTRVSLHEAVHEWESLIRDDIERKGGG